MGRDSPQGFLAAFDRPPAAPVKLLNVDLSTATTAADLILGLGEPLEEIIHRGLVQNGQIVLPKRLTLPEGTEVVIRIEPGAPPTTKGEGENFASLPFFGMWADREDMADSAAWVHGEREQWHQRASRPD